MSRAAVISRATVLCAAGALSLTGCSSAVEGVAENAVERAIENELGESADVEIGEDSFTVDTEEGSISAGAGSVPEDFPADVPLVEGEVAFAQRLESADGTGWSVIITTEGDPASVAEQIRTDLETSGFTVDEASQFGGESGEGGTVLGEKDNLTAFVLVAGDGTETTATYTVNEEMPAS